MLPALPKARSAKGSVTGIGTRGGFTVDFSWRDGDGTPGRKGAQEDLPQARRIREDRPSARREASGVGNTRRLGCPRGTQNQGRFGCL
ncbi:glycoside hydrolase family 95-like protein, partial [Streptomyces hokutonensis]|uniref:glycoside hydrolase family 95-like protein n=1 Tax=Streptomyces hokutonensis TaxID=1306990 RepID=UPI0036751B37